MIKPAIVLINICDKLIDRIVLSQIQPRRFKKRYFAAIALGISFFALLFSPIHSALQNKAKQEDPPFLALYKSSFPEGLRHTGNELTFHCNSANAAILLARKLYSYSYIYDQDELKNQIIARNKDVFANNVCYKETVYLPEPILQPHVNKPLGWGAAEPVHAIYLQGGNSTPKRIQREVARLKQSGANGIVFDVKDIIGVVNYPSSVRIVEEYRKHAPPIRDLSKLIKYLHDNDIYIIARMALFQDQNLAMRRPDLNIKDKGSPTGLLRVKGKPLWVDPGYQEVQDYNHKIVQELILSGVDEIQFDYVRYPAEGNLKQASYHKVQKPADKTAFIANFLSGAHALARVAGVHTSIDIFGVVAWGEDVDINATGQHIEKLARHIDIISPMLYPSHFSNGFDKKARPADEPYYFLREGVARVLEKAQGATVVRPWLQAFKWRVSNYNENYIREQIRGSNDAGGKGWMLWNAGNEYNLSYGAIAPVLRNRTIASR